MPSFLSICHDGWALPSAIRPALDDYAVEGGARTRSTPNKIGNQAPLWHCSSGECWRKVPPPGSPGAGQPGQGIALRGVSGAACWRPMGGVFLGFSWEPGRPTVYEEAVDALGGGDPRFVLGVKLLGGG